MHEQNVAILKGLIAVAWADGVFADAEKQALEGLLAAFGSSDEEADEMRKFAEKPRKLDEIPFKDLSGDDRRMLMSHAVLLSWVDGDQADSERKLLGELAKKLDLSDDE